MTVIRSASGTRIDCDECREHTGMPAPSVEALRRATGYVRHRGRDLCPSCWSSLTGAASQPSPSPTDHGPAAA